MMTMNKKIGVAAVWLLLQWHPVLAQKPNWQNLDRQKDTVFGISTEQAYTLLQHKKPQVVIVGVIDSGVDTAHEDLRAVLWVNPKEKPGNGIDDDHDGYVDDVHGWDFIGGAKGDVAQDNLEVVRLVREERGYYDSLAKLGPIPAKDSAGYSAYRTRLTEYNHEVASARQAVGGTTWFKNVLDSIRMKIGKDSLVLADFQQYTAANNNEQRVRAVMIRNLASGITYGDLLRDGIEGPRKHYQDELDYHLNIDFDPRGIVGDHYADAGERYYGNADVTGPDALHGTHVSGIIGAVRGNGLGIDGVADAVRILAVRVVPDGDERDKDVANGIRYAVDHGAKVINMSFGKAYPKNKAAVDAAVKYAMSKDVLLVQAAGNSGEDLDDPASSNYPNRVYGDGSGEAAGWIVVGATGWVDDSTLLAPFSNYGKRSVDVFAPGVQLYSTIPGSKYMYESGTSMAAPVVTGLAALIRSYYPKLSAVQVKEIILASVVKPDHKMVVGREKARRLAGLDELSVSGGVVNAYKALQFAASYKL
jgi:subtilisin family serine protease